MAQIRVNSEGNPREGSVPSEPNTKLPYLFQVFSVFGFQYNYMYDYFFSREKGGMQ